MNQALRHLKSNLNKALFAQMFSYRDDISACNFSSESNKKKHFVCIFFFHGNEITFCIDDNEIGI